jgi:tape measure domain-containing protein
MDENLRLGVDSTGAVRGLGRFEKSLDEALASADRFSRRTGGAMDRVVDKMGKLRRHPFAKVARAMDQNAKRAEKLGRSADRAGRSFNRLGHRSRRLSGNMRGLENSMNLTFQAGTLLRSMFGFLTLRQFGSSIIDATMSLERFRSVLTAVHEGSLPKIKNEMDFVNQTAHDLAISIDVARKSYGNFSAAAHFAGRTTEETQTVFRNISMALRVMGKSADDQKLAFMALEQMFSKGRVQSEELRRQLGERIPGAVKIFADAAGVGTAEFQHMMKTGKVGVDVILKASEIMEKKFRGGLILALDRVDTKMTRLSNAWQNLLVTVGNSGFLEEFKRQLDAVTAAIKEDEFQKFAQDLGTGLARATRVAGELLVYLLDNARALGRMILIYTGASLAQTVLGWAASFRDLTKAVIASETAMRLFAGTSTAATAAGSGGMFARMGQSLSNVTAKVGALLTSVPALGRVFSALSGALGPVVRFAGRLLSIMGLLNPAVGAVVATLASLGGVFSLMKDEGVNWGDSRAAGRRRFPWCVRQADGLGLPSLGDHHQDIRKDPGSAHFHAAKLVGQRQRFLRGHQGDVHGDRRRESHIRAGGRCRQIR